MSGSGGGIGYDPISPQTCELFTIKTHLASPKVSVISKLSVGDILIVELTPPAGPVHLKTPKDEIAGAILTPEIAQLIQCLTEGHNYHAKIIEIKGGNCQVLITHK